MPLNDPELFGDGELKTRLYLIHCKGRGFLGMGSVDGEEIVTALCLFTSHADALRFRVYYCQDPRVNEDYKNLAVASSDDYGGTLKLLDNATKDFSHVIIGPRWRFPSGAVEINMFAYLLSAYETDVPPEEMMDL
jgi:hypothetical protein